MSLAEPKIICIMPCYNAEKTLAKAIESVINQNYINWELVIVDDASTDKSVQIATKYLENDKVTLLQNKTNRGCYYSRNRGLHHVKDKKWDWFTIHDSDDISHPDRFSVYMASVYDSNMINYIYSGGQGTRYNYREQKLEFVKKLRGVGVSFIHKDIFYSCLGYFDSNTLFGGDGEYEYKYLQVVSTIIKHEVGLDDMKSISDYCIDNKKFIGELGAEYCYLYTYGYTLGNNLTQKISLHEREAYDTQFRKKWGKGGIPLKDFYRDFTPHKEDLQWTV